MPEAKKKTSPSKRVARHRERIKRAGLRRMEVIVPKTDVKRVRDFVHNLLEGDAPADRRRAPQAPPDSGIKTLADLFKVLRQELGDEDIVLDIPPRTYEEPRDVGF